MFCLVPLCVQTERDVSVRQRAADLLYAMCDRSNAKQIVAEMLSYLETADYSIREEMVRRTMMTSVSPNILIAVSLTSYMQGKIQNNGRILFAHNLCQLFLVILIVAIFCVFTVYYRSAELFHTCKWDILKLCLRPEYLLHATPVIHSILYSVIYL